MKRLLIIVCLLISTSAYVSTSGADCTFRVTFDNTTDQKVEYLFYWIDHPYEYALPINLAGGELDAGETTTLGYDYLCGEYYVKWSVGDETRRHAFSHRSINGKTRTLTP